MRTIGASDAKNHFSKLLEEVEKGGEFVITRHGKPIARLIPAEPAGPRRSVDDVIATIRRFRRQIKSRASAEEIAAWKSRANIGSSAPSASLRSLR
ncbi:MAG: type II toxin-antitoxin system prevent-host-death family antitoxin [Pseudomonadota bacterium]|jgi:prevent-host-death family protein